MDNIKKELLLFMFEDYKKITDEKKLIKLFDRHYNQFDYNFYITFYKDLNNINLTDALNHWKKYGKNEGRISNLFQSQYNLAKNLLIISSYRTISFYKKEKKINILIRTSGREKYFSKCIKSILNQNYCNYNIFISYDNLDCEKYLKYNQKNIKYIFIDKKKYNEKYFYNDYLNTLNEEVKDGFIFYLDDDDMFTDNNSLKIINENIVNVNDLLLFKFLRPDRIIFPKKLNHIRIGDIGTSCFCYNSIFSKNIFWEKRQCGDYYFFNNLIKKYNLNIIKIDFIIAKTIYLNKSSNFGL